MLFLCSDKLNPLIEVLSHYPSIVELYVYCFRIDINRLLVPRTEERTVRDSSNLVNRNINTRHRIRHDKDSQSLDNIIVPASHNNNRRKNREKKCKPVKNVIFLKTHKTGSSTVINIMQRYANENNLKVALPTTLHKLGWPHPFQETDLFEHSTGDKYNILCNHAIFNKERMLNIMESKDTKIVTIVRDPLHQFESISKYYYFARLFSLNETANVLDQFFNKSFKDVFEISYKNPYNMGLAKNPITFDMGKDTWNQRNFAINAILMEVRKEFDLVMISDYMSESLVLLKKLLCWDIKDVAYFTMNKRPNEYRQQILNNKRTREKVKQWNKIDYTIFNFYNETFWRKIRNGGKRLQQDVTDLNNLNKRLASKCLHNGINYAESLNWFPKLKKNIPMKSSIYHECEAMLKQEIPFTTFLKLKQTKYNWSLPTKPSIKNLKITRKK